MTGSQCKKHDKRGAGGTGGEVEGRRGEENAQVLSHSSLFLSCFEPRRFVVAPRIPPTLKEDAFQPFINELRDEESLKSALQLA